MQNNPYKILITEAPEPLKQSNSPTFFLTGNGGINLTQVHHEDQENT